MEKYELSVRELEAQRVELLPDRVQMARVRGRGRVRLGADVSLEDLLAVGVLIDIDAEGSVGAE